MWDGTLTFYLVFYVDRPGGGLKLVLTDLVTADVYNFYRTESNFLW